MAEAGKGRHQAPRSRAVIGAGVAVAALAVGGVAYGVSHHGNDSAPAAASSSTTSDSGSSGLDSAELAACRSTVTSGQRVAAAAASSAAHWHEHAGAQWDLDAGRITYSMAEKRWKASKAHGEQDVADFTTAKAAYDKVAGGCDRTASATADTANADAGKACVARAAALAKVASTGDTVNTQWAEHIGLMKTKATAAGPAYHQTWMSETDKARAPLARYDSAAAALAHTAACS